MLKLNKQFIAVALLTVTTLAGTTLHVNQASASRIPRVSPSTIKGFKKGASLGHKAGKLVNKACKIQQEKNPNTNNPLCSN